MKTLSIREKSKKIQCFCLQSQRTWNWNSSGIPWFHENLFGNILSVWRYQGYMEWEIKVKNAREHWLSDSLVSNEKWNTEHFRGQFYFFLNNFIIIMLVLQWWTFQHLNLTVSKFIWFFSVWSETYSTYGSKATAQYKEYLLNFW